MSEKNMQDCSLCSNCKNDSDCTFKKERQKPSFYCEEFEVAESPPIKVTKKERTAANTPVDDEEADSSKFIGLCSNCDNRRTCTFPKPEGGIWHCEEYQ